MSNTYRKRSKQRINAKKTVLSQNNRIEDFYSDEDFVKPSIKKSSDKYCEEQFEAVISDKSLKSNNVFEDILHLLSKKLNLSEQSDQIHDRYKQYLIQSSDQK